MPVNPYVVERAAALYAVEPPGVSRAAPVRASAAKTPAVEADAEADADADAEADAGADADADADADAHTVVDDIVDVASEAFIWLASNSTQKSPAPPSL